MKVNLIPKWMSNLNEQDIEFIKKFVLASGSLKEIAKEYNFTYPTIRLRLDKLIQKIQISESYHEDSYISLIKELAMEEKLDIDTATLLISQYNKYKE